jgi:ABC-2 type transport system permease protein
MRRIIAAEWRKIAAHPHGTRLHVAFVGVSLAGAVLMGVIARQALHFQGPGADEAFLRPALAAIGLLIPGMLVAMAACAYRVASDYDDGTISETFRAMPRRALTLTVKTGLLATTFALPTVVLVPVSFTVAESVAAGTPVLPATILAQGGVRAILAVPVVVFCLCALAAAVASLVRNSALAIAVPIVWYALVEELLPTVPGVGGVVGSVLPVTNGWAFAGFQAGTAAGGPTWAAPVVLLAWVVATSALAALVLERRDVPARS